MGRLLVGCEFGSATAGGAASSEEPGSSSSWSSSSQTRISLSYSLARFPLTSCRLEAGGAPFDEVGGLGVGEPAAGVGGDQVGDQAHQEFVAGDLLGQNLLQDTVEDLPLGPLQLVDPRQAGEGGRAREHLDQDVAQAGQVGPGRTILAIQDFGRRVARGAGRVLGRVVDQERRADVDQFGVTRPLEHDVRRLDVAVDDPLAVQGRERRQALAEDRDGDARLEAGLDRSPPSRSRH